MVNGRHSELGGGVGRKRSMGRSSNVAFGDACSREWDDGDFFPEWWVDGESWRGTTSGTSSSKYGVIQSSSRKLWMRIKASITWRITDLMPRGSRRHMSNITSSCLMYLTSLGRTTSIVNRWYMRSTSSIQNLRFNLCGMTRLCSMGCSITSYISSSCWGGWSQTYVLISVK